MATSFPLRSGSLLLALVVLLLLAAAPAQAAVNQDSVTQKIMCQCGCGAVLENCPHAECGWAIPAKNFIREQLEAGKTPEELIAYYVSQNGEQILAAPEKQGFGLGAWLTPFAVIIATAIAIYSMVRLWVRDRAEAAMALPETPALPKDKSDRLDEELKKFD